MKNNASFVYSFFLVIGDFLALVGAFGGAFLLRVTFSDKAIHQPIPALTYLLIFLLLTPFWLVVFGLLGLYNSNIYEKRFSEVGRLFMGSFVGFLFVIAGSFASVKPIFPAKMVPVYGFILAFAFLVIFRNLARAIRIILFGYNIGISNVLIVGDTTIAAELVESLRHSRTSGYRIIGVVSNKPDAKERFRHTRVFETFEQAMEQLDAASIHSIMQTEMYSSQERNNFILDTAQQQHIAYRFIPGNTELFVGNIQVELFRSSVPVIAVHQTPLIGWGRIVKRLFDFVISVLLLVLLSPLFLIVTIMMKLSNPRASVFFKQTRLTRFNREFYCYKFRTLKPAYNGLLPEEGFAKMGKSELAKTFRQNGDFLPNDPRLTKLGLLLRRTSIDELPQLINVVRGDISLVGPRALVPRDLNKYAKKHTILSIKPGMTGLAVVSGRKNISFEERRKLDMYYVQNWTFWMDIVIIIKTFRAVISHEGAQ
jgi:exopolysaccharide biosynthesis polyprenyl glycosylphosphotransferase